MSEPAGRDGQALLELVGEQGLLAGERREIALGESIVVGRSRSCDLSTRTSRSFREADEAEQRRLLDDPDFLKVSRHHVRITCLSAEHVEIWDLSQNGTFVDGRQVSRLLLPRPGPEGFMIRLGRTELLRLRSAS